jgi:cytochrome P450
MDLSVASAMEMMRHAAEIRDNPRPGLIDALVSLRVDGEPAPDTELIGMLMLLIGGGFDTTTASRRTRWSGSRSIPINASG